MALWFPCCCGGGGGTYPVCSPCPNGDGPENGISFGVSGLANQAFSRCDCTAYDGTFNVPNSGTCTGYLIYQGCYDAGTATYEGIFFTWTTYGASSPYDWQAELQIQFRQGSISPVAIGNSTRVAETTYRCLLTNATKCYELAAESMAYVAGSLYDASGQSCYNLDGLTVNATSY